MERLITRILEVISQAKKFDNWRFVEIATSGFALLAMT
jgi:hypothetical protein